MESSTANNIKLKADVNLDEVLEGFETVGKWFRVESFNGLCHISVHSKTRMIINKGYDDIIEGWVARGLVEPLFDF